MATAASYAEALCGYSDMDMPSPPEIKKKQKANLALHIGPALPRAVDGCGWLPAPSEIYGGMAHPCVSGM
jgi:hypothetical protein